MEKCRKACFIAVLKKNRGELYMQNAKMQLKRKELFASREFVAQYDYVKDDLGAGYEPEQTTFKVWAPTAEKVTLNLYSSDFDENSMEKEESDLKQSILMNQEERGVWSTQVSGDLDGVYYTYSVQVEGISKETADPYARACGVNGKRSMVVDMKRTEPAGWEQDKRPEKINEHPVIYELHIKDFSSDVHSGIKQEWRGKYLAFTQNDTSYDNEGKIPTCLEYLKALGITYVHLLPTFDYGSVDESNPQKDQFNWGYDPVNYNVPEGSYATNASDGHVRIKEFKEMVMALHKAGIGVIMDVVFNHTYNLDVPLQNTVPDYYYRIDEEGNYSNGSECGNDTASERIMFRRYMADSVCYWAKNYHIDGFRFDLMGLHDVETMNYLRERLNELPDGEKILMYGEPWAAGKTSMEENAVPALAKNIHMLDSGIAMFCDKIRDGIKGDVFKLYERGYVNGNAKEVLKFKEDICSGVCAWCNEHEKEIHPKAPSQIINYVSAHDNLTLWDKLVISVKDSADYKQKYSDLIQMNKMAAGIVFTSLGIPFFQAGEEFARTKGGNENSYNLPSSINQLDWKRTEEYKELMEYYRYMIALRKDLPLVERLDADAVSGITFLDTEDAVIGFMMEENNTSKKWKKALVFYNPYDEEKMASLPTEKWYLLTDGVRKMNMDKSESIEKSVCLKPRSVTVMATFD